MFINSCINSNSVYKKTNITDEAYVFLKLKNELIKMVSYYTSYNKYINSGYALYSPTECRKNVVKIFP